jgi:methyl-accepting chemotaxis protein
MRVGRPRRRLEDRVEDKDLDAQVAACLPVLPVLEEQLREASGQIQSAVEGVCNDFSAMASRAKQSVESAATVIGGADGRQGLDTLVDTSRNTLEHLLERIVRSSELSMKAVYRMDDVEDGMERIAKILAQVDGIAASTRVLAVNAKIEAVRVGEQGKGFGVVAAEISELAKSTASFASAIQAIAGELRQEIRATVGELRELASTDMTEVLLSKQEVETALNSMRRSHAAMLEEVEHSAGAAEHLAADITSAVIRLQFQDRVSQRIAHVIDALEEIRGGLAPHVHRLDEETARKAEQKRERIVERLGGCYTMDAERQVLAAKLGQRSVAPAGGDDGVELF